jgi:zinc and cadmium transporter
MSTLLWIIISTFLISFIAIVGIFFLFLKEKLLEKILLILVALSAGALLGGAFLHLIPEAIEKFKNYNIYLYILVGFILFFLVEKLLHWRHCHRAKCPVHTFGYINLLGDGVHNFIDGLIIAASFVANFNLGIITSLAVALHEIPQEIGDFGVLVYAGFKKTKALLLNYISALTVILGGIVGYFLSDFMKSSIGFLLPFAAGGFIYIAASDLIPELRKEQNWKISGGVFLTFLAGLGLMLLVKLL